MSKREMILTIASRQIKKVGYSNFSYADIAKEIGITKPSLHYYFATKEALAIAICDRTEALWQQAFDNVMGNTEIPDALGKIEHLVMLNTHSLKSDEICGLVSLLDSYESFPSALQIRISELVAFEYHLYRQLIQKASEMSELPININVNHCVVELISMIKGALIYRRVNQEFDQIASLLDRLFQYWRKSL